jgi:hypothetical protein
MRRLGACTRSGAARASRSVAVAAASASPVAGRRVATSKNVVARHDSARASGAAGAAGAATAGGAAPAPSDSPDAGSSAAEEPERPPSRRCERLGARASGAGSFLRERRAVSTLVGR